MEGSGPKGTWALAALSAWQVESQPRASSGRGTSTGLGSATMGQPPSSRADSAGNGSGGALPPNSCVPLGTSLHLSSSTKNWD